MAAAEQQASEVNCQSILAIDDDPDFITLLKIIFQKLTPGARFYSYDPEKKGRPDSNFNWSKYDLILLDYDLGDGEKGLDWLRRYKTSEEFPTTVMLTAQGDEEIAVQAMRFGLEDYINKQKLSFDRLSQAVKNAMARKQKQKKLANTLSMQASLFDKASFYKKLRDELKTLDEDQDKHAFILQISIDDYDGLYEKHGILAIDNLCSNMAGKIAKALTSSKFVVNITRLDDSLIGCLITEHADENGGERIGRAICKLIDNYAYTIKDAKLTSTVSIGIMNISRSTAKPDTLLNQVNKACQKAGKKAGNSIVLIRQAGKKAETAQAAVKTDHAAARTNIVILDLDEGVSAQALDTAQKSTPQEQPAGQAADKPASKRRPAAKKTARKETTTAKPPAPDEADEAMAAEAPKYDLHAAVGQNRIQTYYQPFVALSESANMFDAEFFQLTINIVDPDGALISQQAMMEREIEPGGLVLLDRWMIRHGLGQLMLNKKENEQECGLFMRLSADSFTNNDLFDWMVKLIVRTKTSSITSKMVFEISPPEFLSNKKIMQDFINKMRDTWGIAFSLYDVVNPAVLETCVKQAGFEFAKVNLNKASVDDIRPVVESARRLGTLTVIENIQDAEQLNQSVVIGCDYAHGDFIQPRQDALISSNDAIEL